MTSTRKMSDRGPEFFSMSYIQGRPARLRRGTADTVETLKSAGFEECSLDYFCDVQVSRRKHIARLKLPGITLSLRLKSESHAFAAKGTLHVLVGSVGFMIIRLTLTDHGMHRPAHDFPGSFNALHPLAHSLPPSPTSPTNSPL